MGRLEARVARLELARSKPLSEFTAEELALEAGELLFGPDPVKTGGFANLPEMEAWFRRNASSLKDLATARLDEIAAGRLAATLRALARGLRHVGHRGTRCRPRSGCADYGCGRSQRR